MSLLRFKRFFVSLSGSKIIYIFFLIGSTNCHSLYSLILFLFCFVLTELLHDLSCVTILNKHFIKCRINCLFCVWIRLLEHPMSGWFFFFIFQLATEAPYGAANVYCPQINLNLAVFWGKIIIFPPDFAILLICYIFLICAKAYEFVFMWRTINVKVLNTNSAYYKKAVVFLLAALKYLVEEGS